MSAPIDRVLPLLENVKPKAGGGWTSRCKAHASVNSSLSIDVGQDNRVLLKCWAGCEVTAILEAIGLTEADLFERKNGRGGGGVHIPSNNHATTQSPLQPPTGCTLATYAAAKRIPIDKLRSYGVTDAPYFKPPAIRFAYSGESGTEVAARFRLALTGDDRFRWRKGSKAMPYGLSRLKDARAAGYITLGEGESDGHTLWSHDEPYLGIPGADTWKEAWADHLDGIPCIYVVIEPDQGGVTVKKWLATSRIRDRVKLVNLGAHKDPSGLYLSDPDHFLENWKAAMAAATPWPEQAQAEAVVRTGNAWQLCESLAGDPRILDRVILDLVKCGVTGETRAAKLLYLGVVSRFLKKPLAIFVKGPSSAGKSYITEKVLDFFPPSAYYALSAMSERALAYSEEPLQHRILVLYEAAGFQGDIASYLVRSLLSEGCVRYETVVKTADGLKPLLIVREGPTGLITTTTAVKLHPENETRALSVPVTDSPAQTMHVLCSLAEENREEVDFTTWHALQEWIEGADHEVTIPYAGELAKKIPPVAVRLRRDFGAILTLIRTHAVLHQVSRERDDQGRIVATLDDYAVIRDLVADLVAEGVEATVPETIRETVAAIKKLVDGNAGDPTSVVRVAKELRLDKATALRRVRVAIDRDYVQNLEDKRGRPARLILGDALPEEKELLPQPDALASGCAVAVQTEGIHIALPPERVMVYHDGTCPALGGGACNCESLEVA